MTGVGDTLAYGVYTVGSAMRKVYIIVGHRFVLLAMLWIIVEVWMANHSFGWNLIFSPLSWSSILFWLFIIPFVLGIVAFLMTAEDFTVLHSPLFILVALGGYYLIWYRYTSYAPLFHDLFSFSSGGILIGFLILMLSWTISILAYF